VFAARTRRSESLTFRIGYHLVVISEFWNHYAAAVIKARLPHETVDTSRARRLGGQSSMNPAGFTFLPIRDFRVFVGEVIALTGPRST
jgi:hypothetical protein